MAHETSELMELKTGVLCCKVFRVVFLTINHSNFDY